MSQSAENETTRELLVVAHTHWDREWYRTFEAYRYRLIKAVDAIFESDLPHFVLDGQTALVDDYLASRPERYQDIAQGIQSGQLGFGPWFVLVDEFLVSGESLIRNLLLGRAAMEKLGAPKGPVVGYLPDMFGHIAQMPQILAGFGISQAVVWRGANPDRPLFWWLGADGSRVATAWLPQGYYQTPLIEDIDIQKRSGLLRDYTDAFNGQPRAWLLAGADHMAPRQDTNRLINQLNDGLLPFKLRLGSLNDIFEGFESEATLSGELRQPVGLAYILPGVLSARIYLKQANQRAQILLERYAEPLVALSWWSGSSSDDPRRGLQYAWRTLLLNHPHDSICGCSIDEVHQEMMPRFSGCHQVTEEVIAEAVRVYKRPSKRPQTYVFNPSPFPYEGWVDIEVKWASEETAASPASITLCTPIGEPLPTVVREITQEPQFHADLDLLPDWYPATCYRASVYLSLKAWAGITLDAQEGPFASVVPGLGEVKASEGGLENELIHLWIENGALHLQDKRTGKKFHNIHRFIDEADAGDSYNFSPLEADEGLDIPIVAHDLLTPHHPFERTLEVVHAGDVPLSLDAGRRGRSNETAPLRVVSRLTLRSASTSVHVESTVEHVHKDHRLRVVIGPASESATLLTDGTFGLFERPHPTISHLPVPKGQEAVMPEVPTGMFSMLRESNGTGLALAGEGLHEVSILREGAQLSLATTLIRAVGWLSRDDLRTRGGGAGPRFETPEAQCPGPLRFRYAIIPIKESETEASKEAWGLLAPPRSWCGPGPGFNGPLVQWRAPEIIASACKLSESGDAVVVRAYNTSPCPITSPMTFGPEMRDASCAPADLAEKMIGGYQPADDTLVLFKPYEIKTWLLRRKTVQESESAGVPIS